MNIDQAKPKRQKRTIALHLGNTLAEYQATLLTEAGIKALIRQVEIADNLNWGCLATEYEAGCPRQLHFTHHDSYTRWPNTLTVADHPLSLCGSAVWIAGLSFRSNRLLSSATNVTRPMRPRS